MKLSLKKLLLLGTVISLLLGIYSTAIEPYSLNIKRYELSIPLLSGLKIVFAADFHVGPYFFEKDRLEKIVNTINNEKADIVILGGDYVNGHLHSSSMSVDKIAQELGKIKSVYGIYAVLGNHDSYYGKSEVKEALLTSGINVLDNQNISLSIAGKNIYIAGVSDYYTDQPDITSALMNTHQPTILITHSPDIFPQNPQADLILAGHTHGGQIVLPFVGAPLVPSDFGSRYRYGKIQENGKTMIVTKGLGTSLLPIRFNCRPEIIVMLLK